MGTSLFILICSAAILYDADASPLWSWSTFKSIPYNNEFKDCFTGQCLQAWRCPENAVAVETTTACSERKYGPWVCCVPHSEVPSTAEPPAVIKKVAELLPDGYENSNSSVEEESPTPDWVYVAKKDDLNRENNNASSSLSRQNRPNANIINYGRSHGYSSHHSHGGANGGARNVRNFNNQNEYEKGAPESSLIENKWHDPTFDEHPNKDIPESRQYGHASNSWTKSTKNSWDIDHNQDYSRGHTGNHIVKTTPQSRRSTTKKSWDSDYTSSRKTTNKPTPSSRWSPTKDSWDNDYSSSKRTTTREVKPTPSSRWSSTKESWNRDQTFTIQTNSWEDKATPNVWEKTTKKPWDSTTSTRKSSKTSGYGTTSKSWAKSTKASWDWDIASSTEKSTTASSWVGSTKDSWNLDSNSERKSTPSHQGNSATKRPASNISTRKSTRSSTTTAAYPGRQTVQNGPTRPTTRASTRNPEFGNIENSRRATKSTPINARSSTKKITSTTPMPEINLHMCGIRISSRAPSSRGKRDLNSEAIVYGDAAGSIPLSARIVGGKEVEPFSWPWVAALYKVTESGGNRFLSAGSLINENFVLTAAHVFTPDDLRSSSFVVMLGTHNAKEAVGEYTVMYVLRHPDYQQRFYYNDIALLRLERPVAFNEYVMPVCLPSPATPLSRDRDLEGKQVTVMGWGDESYGGKTSRVLREVSFPIASRKACNASYVRVASNRFPRGIVANMLCAGHPNGGKDACQGDSGGPLTTVQNDRHMQVGIVSFGYKCGDKEYPGVYTKVAPYLGWIAENARCDDHHHYYSK